MPAVAPWERQAAPLRVFGGVDLGAEGAMTAIEHGRERLLWVVPLPMSLQLIGRTKRKRLDYASLYEQLQFATEELGVELWTVENPGVGFGAGGRALGEVVGAFRMAAYVQRLRVEWVTPAAWKAQNTGLKVPADKVEACLRAEQLFPHDREKLKGPKGGRDDGKSEAAMIALYGARKFGGSK